MGGLPVDEAIGRQNVLAPKYCMLENALVNSIDMNK
jgi:hypothetical protein